MGGCSDNLIRVWSVLLLLAAAGQRPAAAAAPGSGRDSSLADAERRFTEANRLHDGGRIKEAIAEYAEIVDAGYVSDALFYNLGNAWLAADEPARALLYYRRAWHVSPRDAALRRNTAVAALRAGIAAPRSSRLDAVLEYFSFKEWVIAGAALYWLCACFVGIRIATRLPMKPLRGVIALAAVAFTLAAVGAWHWMGVVARREGVLLRPQRAMFAPRESAAVQFDLREGTIVTTREVNGDWVRVSADGKEGWIPSSAVASVHGADAK